MTEGRTHITPESRCTQRKHVIEKTGHSCDCGRLMVWDTAARNAQVVSLAPEMFVRPDPTPTLPEVELGDGFGI